MVGSVLRIYRSGVMELMAGCPGEMLTDGKVGVADFHSEINRQIAE